MWFLKMYISTLPGRFFTTSATWGVPPTPPPPAILKLCLCAYISRKESK